MRILMLGWEFPPYFSGGLGTVCYALTRALARGGHQVTYLMPKGPDELRAAHGHVKIRIADNEELANLNIKEIDSLLEPYTGSEEYLERYRSHASVLNRQGKAKRLYGQDLINEVHRFAQRALAIALTEEFDVIHAHDWTSFPAAIAIQEATGKPMVVHVHITEFDKSGGEHADPQIYAIEREGMMKADLVIAISNYIKNRCMHNYYVPADKIRVVHNAAEFDEKELSLKTRTIKPHEKIVLFLGRITLQKGPEYFLNAARKVADLDPNVKFIMAGTGDMLPRIIELAAELGLGNKVLFPGFVSREEGAELYRMADLFVMPSVSEPFGLVPLEAMSQGTPAIISKQSGVSEVLSHALKVDFWDIQQLANKMLGALNYRAMHDELSHHGLVEVRSLTWDTPANECVSVYTEAGMRAAGRKGWHKKYGGNKITV